MRPSQAKWKDGLPNRTSSHEKVIEALRYRLASTDKGPLNVKLQNTTPTLKRETSIYSQLYYIGSVLITKCHAGKTNIVKFQSVGLIFINHL